MKKRFGSFIMALLLVLSVSSTAFATPASDASVRLEGSVVDGAVTVDVYLTAEGATNGKLEVSYDAAASVLSSYEVCDDSWISSVNYENDGLVSLAWVGSNLPAEETCVLTLGFEIIDENVTSVVYTGNVVELYAGADLLNGGSDSAKVQIKEEADVPVIPIIPVPTPPEIPTEPEDEDKPGSEPEAQCPFTDISDSWAEEYIIKAWEMGLINGVTETTFEPDSPLTRGAFATLLYRLAGKPAVTTEIPFTDVAEGMYYTDAVIWAYSNGVVNGKSATEFCPNSNISRQELVTMLMRYAVLTGVNVEVSADLGNFSDAADVASWAKAAMEWAVAEGIINGSDGQLIPEVIANREQAAKILVVYAEQ